MSVLTYFPARQQGAALPIALIMLLLMTLIGVSAIRITSFEEKMVSNSRQASLAFEAAEAALLEGESFVQNMTSAQWTAYRNLAPAAAINGGQVPAGQNSPDYMANNVWTNGSPMQLNSAQVPFGTDGFYFIKRIGQRGGVSVLPIDENLVQIYQVTAMGLGRDGSSRSILQTHYLRVPPP